jgi:hypothetical protein
MNEPRISPENTRDKMEDGALLVCAYDDEEKCKRMNLEGAITLKQLRAMEPSLSRDQALIFYCA